MTAVLSAPVRRAAEKATLELPFKIPAREWFSLRGAGEVLGLSESTVEKLYDRGQLTGHSHNAGRGERVHKRVLRVSLLAYALRTADYKDNDSLVDSLCSSLHQCSREQQRRVHNALGLFLEVKS